MRFSQDWRQSGSSSIASKLLQSIRSSFKRLYPSLLRNISNGLQKISDRGSRSMLSKKDQLYLLNSLSFLIRDL